MRKPRMRSRTQTATIAAISMAVAYPRPLVPTPLASTGVREHEDAASGLELERVHVIVHEAGRAARSIVQAEQHFDPSGAALDPFDAPAARVRYLACRDQHPGGRGCRGGHGGNPIISTNLPEFRAQGQGRIPHLA